MFGGISGSQSMEITCQADGQWSDLDTCERKNVIPVFWLLDLEGSHGVGRLDWFYHGSASATTLFHWQDPGLGTERAADRKEKNKCLLLRARGGSFQRCMFVLVTHIFVVGFANCLASSIGLA